MIGGGVRCSTTHWKFSPPPGPATRAPSRPALHRRRHLLPPQTGSAPGRPGLGRGTSGNVKPLRRAAQHDGYFPINLEHPDQLADIATTITGLRRRKTTPYDIAIALPPGADPTPTPRRAPPGGWRSSRRNSVAGPGARRTPRRPVKTAAEGIR
ncbi:hypothetical protein NKG94_16035 [Micromonospora sp. M12]